MVERGNVIDCHEHKHKGIADAVEYCNSTLRSVTIPSNLLINDQLAMTRRRLLVGKDRIVLSVLLTRLLTCS